MCSITTIYEESELAIWSDQEPDQFSERFSRYQGLLYFLASRVLRGEACAIDAVANCWRRASATRQGFASESEFRAWLARIVIDEALTIHREVTEASLAAVSAEYQTAA